MATVGTHETGIIADATALSNGLAYAAAALARRQNVADVRKRLEKDAGLSRTPEATDGEEEAGPGG